jgi:hypothetical protein
MEARWLFDVPLDKIQVIIHPQSIIHSMVQYEDGAVMAQLGMPDMKLPIQYALFYPDRRYLGGKRVDFYALSQMTFMEPDMETFRGLEGLSFCFVSVDADLYAPTASALPVFWERLSPGGAIMVHDYNSLQYKGVKKAVDDFCTEIKILPFPVPDLHGSCVIRK